MSNTNDFRGLRPAALPAPNPTREPVRRDTSFYSEDVVFQVGACLFKVPRCKFEQGSEVFRDMFAMPAVNGIAEGQSDGLPLVLESISEDEFRSLLRIMFRPLYRSSVGEMLEPSLQLDEWTHVLKLTTMWGFSTLRRASIDALRQLLEREDPIQWIALARKYEVRECCCHRCTRSRGASGRCRCMKPSSSAYIWRSSHDFEPEILRLFGEEISPLGLKDIKGMIGLIVGPASAPVFEHSVKRISES